MALTRCNENLELQGAVVQSGTLPVVWDVGTTTDDPFDDPRLSFVRTVLLDLSTSGTVVISGIAVAPHGTCLDFFVIADMGGAEVATFRPNHAANAGENILAPLAVNIDIALDGCISFWYDATAYTGDGAWRVKSYTQ